MVKSNDKKEAKAKTSSKLSDKSKTKAVSKVKSTSKAKSDKKTTNKWGFLAPTREKAKEMEAKYGVHFTPLIDYMKVIFPDIDDWEYAEDCYRLLLISKKGKKVIIIKGAQKYDVHSILSEIKLSDLQDYDCYRSVDYQYAQLTNMVVKHIFGIKVNEPLFDEKIPTLTRPWAQIGLDLKTESILKKEYVGDEKQYQVNFDAYRAQCNNVGISKISVKKLFNLYDYEIDLNASNAISILIGPNGCGKTTILKMIKFMLTGSIEYITLMRKIPFKSITCILSSGKKIKMERLDENNEDFIFFIDNKRIEDFTDFGNELHKKNYYLPIRFKEEERDIQRYFCDYCRHIETRIKELVSARRLIRCVDGSVTKWPLKENERDKFWELCEEKDLKARKEYEQIDKQIFEISDIEKAIKKFSAMMKEFEQIDTEYPWRWTREARMMEDFIERYKVQCINQKEFPCNFVDLLKNTSDDIEDFCKKIMLLKEKINNKFKITKKQLQFCYCRERERAYRRNHRPIPITSEAGVVYFTIGDGENKKEIPIDFLSSGELHDLNMYYDLIFGRPNCIVLIDEPEISQHIEWQERFIDDLSEICEMNNIQALVATHSPNIINDHTDLIANWEIKDGR